MSIHVIVKLQSKLQFSATFAAIYLFPCPLDKLRGRVVFLDVACTAVSGNSVAVVEQQNFEGVNKQSTCSLLVTKDSSIWCFLQSCVLLFAVENIRKEFMLIIKYVAPWFWSWLQSFVEIV